MDYIEESFPGYDESIKMGEYEDVKDIVNEIHGTNSTAIEVRKEFEVAYNKLFDQLALQSPDRIMHILLLFCDEFNIDEAKAYRCLNKQNKELVRAFAKSNCNTHYYEKMEEKKIKEKMEKKGQVYFKCERIDDLFE